MLEPQDFGVGGSSVPPPSPSCQGCSVPCPASKPSSWGDKRRETEAGKGMGLPPAQGPCSPPTPPRRDPASPYPGVWISNPHGEERDLAGLIGFGGEPGCGPWFLAPAPKCCGPPRAQPVSRGGIRYGGGHPTTPPQCPHLTHACAHPPPPQSVGTLLAPCKGGCTHTRTPTPTGTHPASQWGPPPHPTASSSASCWDGLGEMGMPQCLP